MELIELFKTCHDTIAITLIDRHGVKYYEGEVQNALKEEYLHDRVIAICPNFEHVGGLLRPYIAIRTSRK